MVSIMNGLSSLGAGISQFAGTAGLELQRSQLAQQQAILADQLATTRETKLQQGQQTFQSNENTQNRAATATNLAATSAAEMERTRTVVAGSASNNAATIAAENSRSAANRATQVALEQMRLSADPDDVRAARAFKADPTLLDAVTRLNQAKTGIGATLFEASPAQSGGASPTPPAAAGSASEAASSGAAAGAPSAPASSAAAQPPGATPPSTQTAAGKLDASTSDVLNDPKEDKTYSPRAAIVDILQTPNANWNMDLLNRVPLSSRPRVIAMLEGREAPPPTGRVNPVANTYLNTAHMIDPTFDESTWQERFKTRQSIANGPIYNNALALNSSFGHVAQLGADFAKLGNWQSPLLNIPGNWISETVAGSAAVPVTRAAIDTAASEIRRALVGGSAGSITELQEWQRNFPLNGSPSQQIAAIKTAADILKVRMSEMTDQVNTNLGKGIAPTRLLSPKAQQALDAIEKLSVAPPPRTPSDIDPVNFYVPPGGTQVGNQGLVRTPDGNVGTPNAGGLAKPPPPPPGFRIVQ